MSPPLVSVLVVNYNGRAHLRECLEAVASQDYPNLETVLVDNASTDGSREWVRENFPGVRLVESPSNLGFAGGNNLGGRHCRGEWVYFLNNDTRAEPDAVSVLMRAREETPEFSVFGSLLVDHSNPEKVDSAGDTFYWAGFAFSFAGYPASRFQEPRPIASAKAAAVLYPKDLLDRLGWFDEEYFLNLEDMDLSFRSRHAGARILLVPGSRVRHKGSGTIGGLRSKVNAYYSERNLPYLALKTFPLPALLRFLPGLFFSKLVRAFFYARSGSLGAFLRGTAASLPLLLRAWKLRRSVLGNSKLSSREFGAFFRSNWLRDRRDFHRGRFDAPL